MRIKLFLLLSLFFALPAIAQTTGVSGVVLDKSTNAPVQGAIVTIDNQNLTVTTSVDGSFRIANAKPGTDKVSVVGYGFKDWSQNVVIVEGVVDELGKILLDAEKVSDGTDYFGDEDYTINEAELEDEEGASQAISTLSGASDNVYYNAASYDFSLMRFRLRGYDSEYSDTYINGVNFNDATRGRFNYSMIGGMNTAFKRKDVTIGLEANDFSFGQIGGSTDISVFAEDYAPGFNGSVAYTNSNYKLRAMATYSTGLMKSGWAVTMSAIARYADEGVTPGSFYNSWGYFLSAQKVFNKQHSLSFVTFGAPTKRTNSSAVAQEAYDLASDNLYNPNWGWQNGKKRNAKVVEAFDPTAIINWVWKPKEGTTLNTGVGFRSSNYASSALNWCNASDPRPDYYRYLPSYYIDHQEEYDLYVDKWTNDESQRQIDWDNLYQTNYLAKEYAGQPSSVYILENRHSNQVNYQLNSTFNTRLNDFMTLQAGVGVNYSEASYYKTIKDLLGGDYWLDIDQYSERDYPDNPTILQNDLNNPNRKVGVGERFGYDYNINSVKANAWVQNVINLAKWDINYGLNLSYTQFQRVGNMKNGRAPENSYGKGELHQFDNAGVKVGVNYKLDGRNCFVLHGYYGTKAPLSDRAYVSPRIRDGVVAGLSSERLLSGDISYVFSYRALKGSITGFWTEQFNSTERLSFYDDEFQTFMNYALTNVRKSYRGVEVGLKVSITPSFSVSVAGTFSKYQYKNRPMGTRSYENGMSPDTTQIVYLKNYYVSGTPQTCLSVGFNYRAPKMWFFELNGTYMGDSYISLAPNRHEERSDILSNFNSLDEYEAWITDFTKQDKLKNAFVVNASIGKVIYLNRSASMNINLNVNNFLNNRNIQTSGYQQCRINTKDYLTTTTRYPNKYYYAQGLKVFLNVGIKF